MINWQETDRVSQDWLSQSKGCMEDFGDNSAANNENIVDKPDM
jgi:hypothetical protein